MRVLDIDLDFFLADCCPLAEKGSRPALFGHEPWEAESVRAFLENQCLLSQERPIPGRIFETHDSALSYWLELIEEGRLTEPFSVTHVDAHSDLGIGYPGPDFVLYNVLTMPLKKRRDLQAFYEQVKLDEANYLLFALAMRLIDSLDNVRNPKSRPDIPNILYAPGRKDALQLNSFTAKLFEGMNGPEPIVPFHVYDDHTAFLAPAPYDYVSLAISPRYAPKEADALVSIFHEYMLC